MMDIDAERQLVREVELKTAQRKKYLIATVVLAVLSAGLLAGIIALSVVHIRHLNSAATTNADTSLVADQFHFGPGPVVGRPIGPIGVPEADPLVVTPPPSKRRIVVVPVSARHDESSSPPRPTNSTSSPAYTANNNNNGTCKPGTVYGGRQLDELNHDAYMPLMQKALSLSPAALKGGLRDYYHASLRSIFRCVDGGGIELVDACKGGYVVSGGDVVECDAEGESEASPSSGPGLAGI